MASAEETKELVLGPLSSVVTAERVQRVTSPVTGLLPPAFRIASFAYCYFVSAFMLPNSVLGVGGTTFA